MMNTSAASSPVLEAGPLTEARRELLCFLAGHPCARFNRSALIGALGYRCCDRPQGILNALGSLVAERLVDMEYLNGGPVYRLSSRERARDLISGNHRGPCVPGKRG